MAALVATSAVCAGCGRTHESAKLLPLRCSHATPDDDIDHLLRLKVTAPTLVTDDDDNPFIRYRSQLYVYQWGRQLGLSDVEYVRLVRDLDGRVGEVDGSGFRRTPHRWVAELDCFVKDETGNVSGSHKSRHLMGLAIALEIGDRMNIANYERDVPLAIASCGNAALAAAVVAKAAHRKLTVFIPTWAEPATVDRLRALGVELIVCERHQGDPAGDPTVLAFRAAVRSGAFPFSCQGTDVALTIDGGRTLGFELAEDNAGISEVFIQVGGGALASSVSQALEVAMLCGALSSMPRIFAVQTQGCAPLARAWQAVSAGNLLANLDRARTHRSDFMWPWQDAPDSLASGILDDETYDWLSILEWVGKTGGDVIVVDEETLIRAHDRAASLFPVSYTGVAGYAGLMKVREHAALAKPTVLFTGVQR